VDDGIRGGGFLFEEHYLDLLFLEDGRGGIVDAATAEKREFLAQGVALPLRALNLSPNSNSPGSMMIGSMNGMNGMGMGSLNGMINGSMSMNDVRTPRESPNNSPRGKKEGTRRGRGTSLEAVRGAIVVEV
jgi:hypothetical protein